MIKRFRILQIIFFSLAGVIITSRLLLLVLPYPALQAFEQQPYSTVIYDTNGELLQVTALEQGGRREYIPYNEIPKAVKKAFIKAEDSNFYLHHGTDYIALCRAAVQNLKNKKIVRGGSTITMQLVKMMNDNNDISVSRKLHDIFYANVIEAKKSKPKILELYMNSLYFGHNATGIASAARTFYGRKLSELSPEQICCLAVIPRNPTMYDPIKNPDNCAERACELYNKVFHKKLLLQDFRAFLPQTVFSYPYEAPHYVRHILQTEEKTPVKTLSINLELQRYAERLLNDALIQAQDSRISNASLLLIENKTGTPLVWAGNAQFFDGEHSGQIDGVLVKNQPGSSMKPFLYALALETTDDQGQPEFLPNTIIADIPQEFGDEKLYIPSNFNNRYNGPVRLRIALASSLNVPAVYVLNKVGVDNYLNKLFYLGFESLRKTGKDADLGLALGAGEVTLNELVTAFAVFVRDGKDFNNNQIYETDTARIICSMLSDKAARSLGFGYSQTFETKYPTIFKTGTSNQYQNIIALGATKDYTIGVWMGNFSGQTVVGKTGSSLPAWVAKSLFDYIYGDRDSYKNLEFDEPENWTKQKICSLSGKLAGPNCQATVYEYCRNDLSYEQCSWHKNEDGVIQTVYPSEYQQWARTTKPDVTIDYTTSPLYIQSPKDNALFYFSELHKEKQAVSVEVFGGKDDTLKIYYDEEFFAEVSRPFSFQLPVERGEHICTVICGDETDRIRFVIK